MKFKYVLLLLVLVSAWMLSGLNGVVAEEAKLQTKKDVLAVVNGTEITTRQLEVSLDSYTQELSMKTGRKITDSELAAIKSDLMEELINQELLYQAAQKQKTMIDEEKYQARLSQFE
ncbi:MAG: SurA N-terminal domain-containing protein, partial [Proteobacteria bacterium]|nr:SurA N-terminal domain-containing protein [Pseudomonadota bacterium]